MRHCAGVFITFMLALTVGAAYLGSRSALAYAAGEPGEAWPSDSAAYANGQPESLQFLSGTLVVNEVSGEARLAVTRTGSVAGAVAVQYATTGGTATPDVDYTPASGTLTFAEGEASKSISFPINADSIAESDETVEITLSGPTGGASVGTPSVSVVTIVDPRSTTQPGRVLTSKGAVVEFNPDASNGVNLTANPFETGCSDQPRYGDAHPSVSRDGKLVAFQSTRDPNTGTQGGFRIFVMNYDGTNVRQLTFNAPPDEFQSSEVRDRYPVISPDGTRVAFISNRSVYTFGDGFKLRPYDIYVVNTDGTGLRRVTTFQPHEGGGIFGSEVVSVVWSPDGARLAFRGIRLLVDNGTTTDQFKSVVGLINADGTGEATLATTPSTGQSAALDWSPDGRIAYRWGGEAQGASTSRLTVVGVGEFLDTDYPAVSDAPRDPGSIRFSPDGQRIGWINFQGRFVSVNADATERLESPPLGIAAGEPLWWQPGAPVPVSARLELAPDPVTVWQDHSVQMMPTLFDAHGNRIARAATAWSVEPCSGGTARVSHTGLVTGTQDANYTGQTCASNGGLRTCVMLQNFETPVLSVSATTPEIARSGAGAPGAFTITRTGNSGTGLPVSFTLGGTAIRDVDYFIENSAPLSGDTVPMSSGVTSLTLNVRPLNNPTSSGDKTVIFTLQPDSSNTYLLNSQLNSARVTLRDDNLPPPPSPSPTPAQTPVLSRISPDKGGDGGNVTATVFGLNIQPGATVKLSRAGQPDIVGSSPIVRDDGRALTAVFNLAGAARGAWDVVVSDADNQTATLGGAFVVHESEGARVWVDVFGRYTFRSGLTEKFYLAYGNRGDVDTEPTLIQVFIPEGLRLEGLPALSDGSIPALQPMGNGMLLEFYLTSLAAGSSSYLPINLTADPAFAHQSVKIHAFAMSSPSLRRTTDVTADPTATYTTEILEQTDNYLKTVTHFVTAAGTHDMVNEFIVEEDTEARPRTYDIVENGDTVQYITSVSVPDDEPSATQGARRLRPAGKYKKIMQITTEDETIEDEIFVKLIHWTRYKVNRDLLVDCLIRQGVLFSFNPDELRRYYKRLGKASFMLEVGDYVSYEVEKGGILDNGSVLRRYMGQHLFLKDAKSIDPLLGAWIYNMFLASRDEHPVPSDLQKIYDTGHSDLDFDWRNQLLLRLIQRCQCENPASPSSNRALSRKAASVSAMTNAASCSTCPGGQCKLAEREVNVEIVFSSDPNEKIGTQGAGEQHYVTGADPLNYSVFFENKPEATAPAQRVVITDQLDTSKLDLSTFSLGTFAFGDTVVAVTPGLSDYTTDVDLRPGKNLIVRISSELDEATGLLTVQFTSLDPATMQPTADPLAGFLPPNVSSPEGQGSVTFNVAPKSHLVAGDEIRNKARIVFDSNAPIETPEWLNTIDDSKPRSEVAPPAFTDCERFEVRWSGTDTGAGIQSYSVYVSEDGGPFTLWQVNTTSTSETFGGQPGKTYSFYSVARDGAGNIEDAPPAPDATISVSADTTPPAASATTSTRPNAAGWFNSDVSVTLTAADGTACSSGVSHITYSAVGAQPAADTTISGDSVTLLITREGTTTITYQAVDKAGNVSAPRTLSINLDKTGPSISLQRPDGADYLLNQFVAADFLCVDSTSGVARCGSTANSDGSVSTASVGVQTFAVSAADRAGNNSARALNYNVTYGIRLLYDPAHVKNSGSAYPVKLQLVDASGANLSAADIAVQALGIRQSPGNSQPLLVRSFGNSQPDSLFRFTEGAYHFNVNTRGLAPGDYLLTFKVSSDPVTHAAPFSVR